MKEIVCPECGKVLEAGVATCPNCGCHIASECPTVPCPHCGNMIAENATCPKCGGHFETTPKCGTLRIKIGQVKSAGKKATAPLYVNGQLVEVVSLVKGGDITVPLTHPNITITYKTFIATLERSYVLSTQNDFTLEIVYDIVAAGFVLYDNSDNEISKDVISIWGRLFCLFPILSFAMSYICRNSNPVRSQYMRGFSLFLLLLELSAVISSIPIN